jgi:flagella basal body P-ring formation protein FlgA
MRRALVIAVCLVAVTLAGQAFAEASRSVVVQGDTIRLGDLFTFAGAEAGKAVAPAPRPGMSEVFEADRLRAIAQRHQLAAPADGLPGRVVVERASRLVEPDEIAAAIRAGLAGRNLGGDAEVELDGRMRRIYAASEAKTPVRAFDVSYDSRTSRFVATLAVATGSEATDQVQVGGRIVQMAEVPVLSRDVAAGEVLTAADLRPQRMRRDQVQRTMLADARELIGKAARRPLREGAPVRTADVREPVVVAKGAVVTLYFQTPRLLVTAKGRANQDGAIGDTVAVVNIQSSKTVEGVVTGPDQVQIPTVVAVGQ